MQIKATFFTLFLLLGLAGCSLAPAMHGPHNTNSNQPTDSIIPIDSKLVDELAKQKLQPYHVGSQDILAITVWQHPEFNFSSETNYQVADNGSITLPIVGQVRAASLTIEQIQESLLNKLAKYINRPEVNIRVTDYQSQKVYVMGEVIKPRSLAITAAHLNLAEALDSVGGINPKTADARYIYVIRSTPTAYKAYWLNAQSVTAMLLAERFYLEPNDIVFVATAKLTRWKRSIDQLFPSF